MRSSEFNNQSFEFGVESAHFLPMARFEIQGKPIDFEDHGYDTRRECRDRASAEAMCGLKIHAYHDEVCAKNAAQQMELEALERPACALHAYLYDCPDPVDDAEMTPGPT